jgi:hypothetical protein
LEDEDEVELVAFVGSRSMNDGVGVIVETLAGARPSRPPVSCPATIIPVH